MTETPGPWELYWAWPDRRLLTEDRKKKRQGQDVIATDALSVRLVHELAAS